LGSEVYTRRRLERIDPSIEAWTRGIWPSLRATILTINSVAFPKLAFNNPPIVCPTFLLNSSVAKLNNDANGMIARKLNANTISGLHLSAPEIIPRGKKTNNTLT
jgi:hypothetical protein